MVLAVAIEVWASVVIVTVGKTEFMVQPWGWSATDQGRSADLSNVSFELMPGRLSDSIGEAFLCKGQQIRILRV